MLLIDLSMKIDNLCMYNRKKVLFSIKESQVDQKVILNLLRDIGQRNRNEVPTNEHKDQIKMTGKDDERRQSLLKRFSIAGCRS